MHSKNIYNTSLRTAQHYNIYNNITQKQCLCLFYLKLHLNSDVHNVTQSAVMSLIITIMSRYMITFSPQLFRDVYDKYHLINVIIEYFGSNLLKLGH